MSNVIGGDLLDSSREATRDSGHRPVEAQNPSQICLAGSFHHHIFHFTQVANSRFPGPYNPPMQRLAPLLFLLLPACGMKGPLYEPAPPAAEPTTTEPSTGDTDKGDLKTIPSTPDPAQSL